MFPFVFWKKENTYRHEILNHSQTPLLFCSFPCILSMQIKEEKTLGRMVLPNWKKLMVAMFSCYQRLAESYFNMTANITHWCDYSKEECHWCSVTSQWLQLDGPDGWGPAGQTDSLKTGQQGHGWGKVDFLNQAKKKVSKWIIGALILRLLNKTWIKRTSFWIYLATPSQISWISSFL